MSKKLLLESTVADNIVQITLNRPDKLNALNTDLLTSLSAELNDLSNNKNLRVVIITGSGEKAFCTGADLTERKTMSLVDTKHFVELISKTFLQIVDFPVPVIAAINGFAFGGGLELALACDFRLAQENALLGLTECALGIIPGAGGTQRLPQLVGIAKAKELIFMSQKISAKEAKAIGLVNYVLETKLDLLNTAKEWAKQIAKCAPLSIKAAKKAVDSSLFLDKSAGLALELRLYENILSSADRIEGLVAFAEKREPIFKNS